MTWKRIKRKSLARLRRISSNLDSGPGGENTKQTANHSASLSVSRPLWDQTGVTFPAVCCWGLFLSPKRILGIGADNVTILHLQTNIWGSDTSQVQSNHRNLQTGVNINCRSSDRKSGRERERRDTEIGSAVSAEYLHAHAVASCYGWSNLRSAQLKFLHRQTRELLVQWQVRER